MEGADKKIPAALLALLLGGLGAHKFYLGRPVPGLIQITLNLACGAGALLGLLEGVIYLTKPDEEFVATYVVGQKSWL